jgi:hypothetical protein
MKIDARPLECVPRAQARSEVFFLLRRKRDDFDLCIERLAEFRMHGQLAQLGRMH